MRYEVYIGRYKYKTPAKVVTWGGEVVFATPSLASFIGKTSEELFAWLYFRDIEWSITGAGGM